MVRRSNWWWLSGFGMALTLFGVICTGIVGHRGGGAASAGADSDRPAAVPVRTAVISAAPLETVIGATAVAMPSETAAIWVGSGLGVRDREIVVEKVHVFEGQEVGVGDLLVELEDSIFAQAAKQQEAALSAARAKLAAMTELKANGVATEFEVDSAQLRVELTDLRHKIALKDLRSCHVSSPTEGFADAVSVVSGEHINAGREITRIHRLNPIHLRVDFPQERLEEVSVGSSAEVSLDSFPGEKFEGAVVRISPSVDTRTRVMPVVVEVKNPANRIKAGITGFARFRRTRTALLVPATGVIRHGDRAMVFRVEDGIARIREVLVGEHVAVGALEVLDGLAAGDEVVIYGKERLQHGDRVDVDWREWSGRE